MPLHTRRQRRLLVAAYAAIVLGMAAIPIVRGKTIFVPLLSSALTLAGLLGGIKSGGPVKPYSSAARGALEGSGIEELNLNGRRASWALPLLDEREVHERDHAHYVAFILLRWTVAAAAILTCVVMRTHPAWMMRNGVVLLWLLVLFVLSLPQMVILWIEPSPPGEKDAMLQPNLF